MPKSVGVAESQDQFLNSILYVLAPHLEGKLGGQKVRHKNPQQSNR